MLVWFATWFLTRLWGRAGARLSTEGKSATTVAVLGIDFDRGDGFGGSGTLGLGALKTGGVGIAGLLDFGEEGRFGGWGGEKGDRFFPLLGDECPIVSILCRLAHTAGAGGFVLCGLELERDRALGTGLSRFCQCFRVGTGVGECGGAFSGRSIGLADFTPSGHEVLNGADRLIVAWPLAGSGDRYASAEEKERGEGRKNRSKHDDHDHSGAKHRIGGTD